MYCTPEKKPTPASASTFILIWISLLHNVVKRVRNRTSRFRCVFSTTDGPLKVDVYWAYGSAHTFSHLNYMKPSSILPYPRLTFVRFE
jgi:hypothetical protein